MVAVARLDGRLARALRKILMEPAENMKMDEKEWEAVRDGGIYRDIYEKYRYELFGLVSSKIGGEAKKIATKIAPSQQKRRFKSKTTLAKNSKHR